MKIPVLPIALGLAVLIPLPLMAEPAVTPSSAVDSLPPLDPAVVVAAAATVTPAAYPDADDVAVDSLSRVEYRLDGTSTRTDEYWTKILTEKGRRDNQVASFNYSVFYEQFSVGTLEVYKSDGRKVVLDPAALGREVVADDSGSNIYDPNDKQMSVAIPGLEVGDLVRFITHRHEKHPRFFGHFSDIQMFEGRSPILHSRYEATGPAALPLQAVQVLDAVGGTVVAQEDISRSGRTWRCWEARQVPQYFPEPSMPESWSCIQRLAVSTSPKWQDVSRWYYGLCRDHLAKVTPAMKEKVAALIAGARDREDRIRRIFRFVSQDIRYMGVTDETCAPGYEPHDVSLTFEKRYGVCRDKAALLVALLNLAGEKAYPVLINAGPRLPVEVPAPMFNHAITAVQEPDGRFRLMDSTNENTADLLPAYLQNCSYLVAHPDGETLRVSPVPPAEESLADCRIRAELLADRSLTAKVEMRMGGINDTMLRGGFAMRKPEEVRRWMERRLKDAVPGAEITDLDISPRDIRDTSQPLVLRLAFRVQGALVDSGDRTFLRLPWCGRRFGLAAQILEDACGLQQRRFPLNTEIACGIREDLEVHLPPGFGKAFALPTSHDVDSPELRFAQHVTQEGEVLKGHSELLLRQPEISPAGYPKLRQSVAQIAMAAREEPLFARVDAVTPDARVLADHTQVEVHDIHHWTETRTVKRQILTYAGKMAAGELRVPYNPAFDTVVVRRARVTGVDGTVRDISPKEINELDAPWAADAPRYPAGKVLVATLPSLEIGATAELEVSVEHRDRPFFSLARDFAGMDPCDQCTLGMVYPPSLALKFADTVGGQSKPGHFSAEHVYAATPREAGQPALSLFSPHVVVSAGDEKALARSVAERVATLGDGGAVVAEKARAIAAKETSLGGRTQAIRCELARLVRSAGPTLFEAPLSALSRPETTLTDGYGSVSDQAILLSAMLKAVGVPARLVLAADEPAKALERVAGGSLRSDLYDRLVCVATLDGQDVMLDEWNPYAELGTSALEGCPLLEFDGCARTGEVTGRFHPVDARQVDIAVQADGSALLQVTRTFSGAGFSAFRQQFTEMTPELRRRLQQESLAGLAPDAESKSEWAIDLAYPGKMTYSARLPHFAIVAGDALYFDLPLAVTQFSKLAQSDHRLTPLVQDQDDDSIVDWRVTLPPGYVLRGHAPEFRWRGAGALGSVLVASSFEQGVLHVQEQVDRNPALTQPGEYPALLEANRQLAHAPWRVLLGRQAAP